MIDVGNGMYILPGIYGYTLSVKKKVKKKNKETGEEVIEDGFESLSYHGSVASALSEVCRREQRKALSDKDFTVQEAVNVLTEVNEKFMRMLNELHRKEGINV